MARPPIITLTTDFGLQDPYVASVKGVILQIASEVRMVDVSHLVPPQDVSGGAYLVRGVTAYFPEDTIHVAVVDPGVGTSQRPIAVQGARGIFVGPDNGIFAPVLQDQGCLQSGRLISGRAVELTNPQFRLPVVSRTFHGRDVFAPAAAHLAAGVPIAQLGPTIASLQTLEATLEATDGTSVAGTIVHVDRFGNAISDIERAALPASPVFHIAGRTLRGLATTYQDAPVVVLEGSTGLIEVAARNGSAAELLGIQPGDIVTVRSED